MGRNFSEKLWIMCVCLCEWNESACNPGSSDRIAHVGKMGDGTFIFYFHFFLWSTFFFLQASFLPPLSQKGEREGGMADIGLKFFFFPLGTEYPTSVERFLTCMNTPDPGSSFNFFCRTCSGPTQKWNLEFSSGLGSSNKYIRILVLPHPISVRFRYSENQVQFWVTQIWIDNKHLINLGLAPNSSFFFPKNSRSSFTHKWNQELGLYSCMVSIPKIKLDFSFWF